MWTLISWKLKSRDLLDRGKFGGKDVGEVMVRAACEGDGNDGDMECWILSCLRGFGNGQTD